VVKILFWNLNRKDLRHHVCEAARWSSSDVVVLIESSETSAQTLKALRSDVSPSFYYPLCTPGRFQLFCRDVSLNLAEIYGGDRVSLRRFTYAGTELLLGLVHVVDRRNWDQLNQSTQVSLLAGDIRHKEDEQGHSRTILIGDFNMNPFDQAMNMAAGMNAMMSTKCVERGSRTLQNKEYHYFYNPMWGLFGDRTPGPSGTYYHLNSANGLYGWNMLDQVLFRPAAIPWFEDIQILTKAGGKLLHTQSGRPNKNAASDHFPLLLTLK
jgi:endonuclease/exonuclease/phosphatase (EEP) superfamily protein YafD